MLDHPTELQDLLNRLQAFTAEEIAEKIEEGCKLAAAYLESGDDALGNLRTMLTLRRTGPLPPSLIPIVVSLLKEVWDDLDGDGGGMTIEKLHGRLESVIWESPMITFRIERHGATVLGSSRAEVQEWTVDLERRTKAVRTVGRRQVTPMQPKLDVTPIAEEIADAILAGRPDDRLKWERADRVRVVIGKVLPGNSAVRETLAGRRKRLREGLCAILATAGWQMTSANVFEKRTLPIPPLGKTL